MIKRKAIVIGATGLIGKTCVELLLNDTEYESVTVLVRRKTNLIHPKLKEEITDFSRLTNHAHALAGDDLFCCLGTTIRQAGSQNAFFKVDFTYVYEAARIAAQNGVRQFLLVSALGANSQSKIFYNRVKGQLEEAVYALGFKSVHIFRPSFLMGKRTEFRIGEKIAIILFRLLELVLIGRWRKYRAIESDVVAKAMIVMAKLDTQKKTAYDSDVIKAIVDEYERTKP